MVLFFSSVWSVGLRGIKREHRIKTLPRNLKVEEVFKETIHVYTKLALANAGPTPGQHCCSLARLRGTRIPSSMRPSPSDSRVLQKDESVHEHPTLADHQANVKDVDLMVSQRWASYRGGLVCAPCSPTTSGFLWQTGWHGQSVNKAIMIRRLIKANLLQSWKHGVFVHKLIKKTRRLYSGKSILFMTIYGLDWSFNNFYFKFTLVVVLFDPTI